MRRLLSFLLCLVVLPCQAEIRDQVEVDALHQDVEQRIAAGQYERILQDADRYLATKARLPDGRWRLSILYGGIELGAPKAFHSPAQWEQCAAAMASLAKKHPHSMNAWAILAQLEGARGWTARGDDYASGVPDEDMAVFRMQIAKERALLAAHPAPANPQWQDLRIRAAADAGASQAELDRLFAAAIKREPSYHPLWFTRLTYALPRWGGSIDRVIALVNQAGTRTSPEEGHGMMARLLWATSALGEGELADSPRIDWKAVKISFDDVLKRYPDDWNAQWFFFEAALHGDKAEAQYLLKFVKEDMSPAVLGRYRKIYPLAVGWAKGTEQGFVIRNPKTGEERFVE